ncbi:ROK family protein [Psychromonas aquimarina]|uniref:ROK family protein n=1 Tax=Psychromonas aquimarina TaxID=444919 RepID=UPI00040EE047|nr:ROK family protein [Psychromonas aquimarina]
MVQNNQQAGSVIANIDHIKQANSATIYKVIEKYAPISRVKIAKVSKLAPASVTKITRQLLESGIISETARQASTGGRCAISLAPNSASIYVLAVKIGQKLLSLSRYNLAGEQLSNKQVNIQGEDGEQLIELLISEIDHYINNELHNADKISAISITLSGLINPKQGRVVYTPHYSFKDYPLVEVIEQRFNLPTFIGNHTRSLALAEHYFGATKNCADSILVTIHHGVGSGIIIQGKALLGQNFNIGEIGHIQANPAGKQCHCGNFGCLETEVSDRVILEKVESAIRQGCFTQLEPQDISIDSIYQAAAANDPLCQKIIEDAAVYLGKTVAILINLLNPQKIIIAGKITQAENSLFSTINQCITHQALPDFQKELKIEAAQLNPNSTVAAFALIKQALYEGDLLQKIKI